MVIAIRFVKEGGNPQKALNIGEFGSSGIMVIVMYFLINNNVDTNAMGIFYATLIGRQHSVRD